MGGSNSKELSKYFGRRRSFAREIPADLLDNFELIDIESIRNDQEKEAEDYKEMQMEHRFPIAIKRKRGDRVQKFIISQFKNKSDVFEFLKSSEFIESQIELDDVLFIKFLINDSCSQLNANEIESLFDMFENKAVIAAFERGNEISTYWKSKNLQKILTLQHLKELCAEDNIMLHEFIADFLVYSLKNGQLGLHSSFDIDQDNKNIDLHLLSDSRNHNLMLLAAKHGESEIVRILASLGMNTNLPNSNVNAQNLAWIGHHCDVIYELVQANLTYPDSCDNSKFTGKLQEFYKNIENLHEAIKANDMEKVKEILCQFPNHRHFYNSSNESALKTAILSESMEMYEYLLSQKIMFGSHEEPNEIFENLSKRNKRAVREIHNKYTQHSPEKHLNILMANSFICHDDLNVGDKIDIVQKAYKILNENVLIRIILMVVAASKNFKIIFDFKREAVNVADPTVDSYTQGLFYPMGRIYVGAKQLLDDATQNETLANLAHELCHFAMNLAYENNANPYRKNDHLTMQEFEEISTNCRLKSGKEDVIDMVYDCYSNEMNHAELIVRVVHLLALYFGKPEKLKEVQETFHDLFEFYEKKTVLELEAALPEIENKTEKEIEKNVKNAMRHKRISILMIILSVFGILGAALVGYLLYKPIYNYNELPEGSKVMIHNAMLKYKGVDVKFKDLLTEMSTSLLISDHIAQILNRKVLNLDDDRLLYLNEKIYLNWKNLTENLKQKFLNSNFTFQNEIINFMDVNINQTFKSLTSKEIIDVLSGENLIIGSMIKDQTNFYVARTFAAADNNQYSIDEIIDQINKKKIFVLSSDAGAGKTVTFKQIALKVKKKYPTRWVSYIDIKDFTKFYSPENDQSINPEQLLIDIFDLEAKSKFEKNLFLALYRSSNVVLLWNGFDEISQKYHRNILDVFGAIYRTTNNLQYICTRPLYKSEFPGYYRNIHDLVPLNENEQQEFISKFYEFKNVTDSEHKKYAEKIFKIIETLKSKSEKRKSFGDFKTPLMLVMIAELIHENDEIYDSENLYQIFEIFVQKKIEIWRSKIEFASRFSDSLLNRNRKFDIIEVYQRYALKIELSNFDIVTQINAKKLKIMRSTIPKELTGEEISRMGILYINSDKNIQFAHRIFSEFFVAQYLIENIYNAEDVGIEELEFRFMLFYEVTRQYGRNQLIITDFMTSYLETQDGIENGSFDSNLSEVLRSKFKRLFFNLLDTGNAEIFQFLSKFFKKDHSVLVELLQIDESETLCTATFNPVYFLNYNHLDPVIIEDLGKKLLTSSEYEKFINGKNQKGITAFGTYYNNKQTSENTVSNTTLFNETTVQMEDLTAFENIAKNLSKDELNELLFTAVSPIYGADRLFIYKKFWKIVEVLCTKEELKAIFPNIFEVISNTVFYDDEIIAIFPFIIKKVEEYLTNSEIYDLISNGNFLHKTVESVTSFEILWKFFVNHSTLEQQKEMLKRNFYKECFLDPFEYKIREQKCYAYPQFKILHINAYLPLTYIYDRAGVVELNFFKNIYSIYFNVDERRQIILSSNEFVPYLITFDEFHFFYFTLKIYFWMILLMQKRN